jgi:D-xylose 1-dehydrogenase
MSSPANANVRLADTAFARYPSLVDRTVLITGGATGIGASFVEHFAAQGARVGFIDTDAEAAERLTGTLGKARANVAFARADLRDIAALRRAIAALRETLGSFTVLVNNAARDDRHTLEEVTPAYWDERIAVNLRHQFFAIQTIAPGMKKAGGGSIINISSVAGLRANQSTPYSTSKAAVVGITRSMAGDHGRDGIRVNCILPGLIYGPMTAPRMDEEIRRKRREAGALGTEGTGWDVAWAAVFLASDEARWITGVALPVDAGFLVMSPTTNVRLAQQKL